jgi:hypothetical protein
MKVKLFTVATALFMLCVPLLGTTAVELSDQALAVGADLIVIGECAGLQSVWVDGVLVTQATVRVSEVLKGTAGDEVVVTLPGGADANRKFPIAMTYAGAPQLRVGEQTFLFLNSDETYGATVSGFSQGKFSIIDDGGEQLITRDLTRLTLSTGTGVVRGGTASRKKLSEFKNEVLGYLGQGN